MCREVGSHGSGHRGRSLLRAAVSSVKSLAESEDGEEISGDLRLERARGRRVNKWPRDVYCNVCL